MVFYLWRTISVRRYFSLDMSSLALQYCTSQYLQCTCHTNARAWLKDKMGHSHKTSVQSQMTPVLSFDTDRSKKTTSLLSEQLDDRVSNVPTTRPSYRLCMNGSGKSKGLTLSYETARASNRQAHFLLNQDVQKFNKFNNTAHYVHLK